MGFWSIPFRNPTSKLMTKYSIKPHAISHSDAWFGCFDQMNFGKMKKEKETSNLSLQRMV